MLGSDDRGAGPRSRATLALAVAIWLLAAPSASGAPAASSEPASVVLPAPNGQPRPDTRVWQPPLSAPTDRRRRIALTLQPSFAAWRFPFIGRPDRPWRGVGLISEVDVRVWRSLWVRGSASYTAHPVENEYARNKDEEIVQTATRGTLHSAGAALGLAYALDLGRLLPLLELGVGGMLVRTPGAVQDGQRGAACRSDGACDSGLRCGADNVCVQAVLPTVHAGIGVDLLVRDHLSLGAGVRYYAILNTPGVFPIYLTGSIRLGVRW